MNNDANLASGNIVPEVLQPESPIAQRNLVTVLVLSVTLARQILGKNTPKHGKLEKGQGKRIVTAIENAIKETFPEIAGTILGLFGLEMINLMPLLNNPDKLVADMVKNYANTIPNDVAPSPQSYMG